MPKRRPPIQRIPDTPENIALACMQGPPKKDWEYLKKKGQKPVKGAKKDQAR